MAKKCLNCSKFLTCRDLKKVKVVGHSCDSWKRIAKEHPANAVLLPKGEVEWASTVEELLPNNADDNFVADAMAKAYDPETNTVRDLRVDDSSLPMAKNFFDFCCRVIGTGQMPFARQMYMSYILLAEFCPRCTKPFWYEDIMNIPVDMDPKDFRKKVAFLEFGLCPYCEATKYELVASGELHDKTELIMIAGQRCVTKETIATTTEGLITFESLARLHPRTSGFHPYVGPNFINEMGKVVRPSEFYVSEKGKTLTVKTGLGYSVTGTPDHPLWTESGWVKLGDLKPGVMIPIKVGQNIWGTSTDITPRVRAGISQFTKNLHPSTSGPKRLCENAEWVANDLTPDLSAFLGYYVAEGYLYDGRGLSIANYDISILEFCEKVLDTVSPGVLTDIQRTSISGIRFSNSKIAAIFDVLLDGQLRNKARSADKFIPSVILRAPKDCVLAFVRALYEGDGCVNGMSVDYTSLSLKLVQQLQIVMANIGIATKITYSMSWATNGSPSQVSKPVYNLRIFGNKSRRLFRDLVGFVSSRKTDSLNDRIAVYGPDKRHNSGIMEMFPLSYNSLIYSVLTQVNDELTKVEYLDCLNRTQTLSLRMFGNGVKRIQNKIKIGGLTSRYRVAKVVNGLRNSKAWPNLSSTTKKSLEALERVALDESIYWTEVTSVSKAKDQVTYDVTIPNGHRFIANGLLNHNSGKSTVSVMLIAYVTHVLLKSPKLSSMYSGIQEFSPLTCTMVATTSHQAAKTLWSPFRRLIASSSWYRELFQILDAKRLETGKELYQFKQVNGLYLRLFHRNLDLYSSGPAKRTLRGDTRFAAVTDELGLFPFNPDQSEDGDEDDRERANADEVHQSLSNSLTTVQGAIIAAREKGINHLCQGINFNISSPFSWMDKICRLYLENNDNPNACCVKQPTWEITPMFPREHPTIVAAYRRNAKKAERDYGANPPKIGSDFYQRDSALKCFQVQPWYGVTYEASSVNTVAKAVRRYQSAKHPASVLAIDAGATNNAFSLALSYRKGGDIVVPVLIEVVPQPNKPIHYPSMYSNVILPICRACNVKVLLSDRWNSLQILQQAQDDVKDLKSQQYSLKMGDFTNVVSLVESSCLIFPIMELDPGKVELITDYKRELRDHPADHLYLQMLTVQEIGGTVAKGSSPSGIRYTDDLHRAMVLSVTGILNERVAKYISKFKEVEREISDNPGILVSGNSSFNYSQMFQGGLGRRRY